MRTFQNAPKLTGWLANISLHQKQYYWLSKPKTTFMKHTIILIFFFSFSLADIHAQDTSHFTSTEIIYGRKDGMALTLIKLSPKEKSNGKGIINVVSGNFVSSFEWVPRYIERSQKFIDHGFTVFLVLHGSQPRYAIPDEIKDVKRAVQFVRYHAADYGIDPKHIGITGSSAGGHLSLMVGLSDDSVNADSKDPVDKVSSRVQAVAVFFPPTDFLNYGYKKLSPLQNQEVMRKQGVAAAFDFKEWNDSTKTITSITDSTKRMQIAKEISPAYFVTSDDPPVLIIHGDADKVVPLQQSQLIIKELQDAKVPNQLIIKPGRGHGWTGISTDEEIFVGWFEKWLK